MLKIVFIDDSKLVLKTIENILEDKISGGEISCSFFDDPLKLYEVLKNEEIDFQLIFVDINMPGMNGYELVKRMKHIGKYRNKFTAAMTTEVSLEAKIKGKAAGMNAWISKMASPETMKSEMLKYINGIARKLNQ